MTASYLVSVFYSYVIILLMVFIKEITAFIILAKEVSTISFMAFDIAKIIEGRESRVNAAPMDVIFYAIRLIIAGKSLTIMVDKFLKRTGITARQKARILSYYLAKVSPKMVGKFAMI